MNFINNRMNKYFLSILILASLSFSMLMAQEMKPLQDPSSFKASVQALAKKTQTIQSDFVQQKHLSVLEEKIVSKGKFYFKEGNKLRWEYSSPFSYLIILNGDKVIIKDGDKVSSFDTRSNQMFQQINGMMLSLVQGNVLETDEFKIGYFENATHNIIEMTPQSAQTREFLQKVHIFFDRNDHSVAAIKMIELSGDFTRIDFKGKKLNADLAESMFVVK